MTNGIKQTFGEIQEEAKRCLYCVDAPCQKGCPANVDVAQFIRHLRYGDVKSAKRVIKEANPLGGICASLCPSENLCQKNCTRNRCGTPVHIRDLQKFACANGQYRPVLAPLNGKKVAVIGAGPHWRPWGMRRMSWKRIQMPQGLYPVKFRVPASAWM